jgi:hypothetical protein
MMRFKRRRKSNPVVGLIWRWDRLDHLRLAEALHWERNVLPFGWGIVTDYRPVPSLETSGE